MAYQKAQPLYNWDLVAYVGVMYSYDINDKKELHDKTYATINLKFHILSGMHINTVDYAIRWQVIVSIYEQLPFYSVKPIYSCTDIYTK